MRVASAGRQPWALPSVMDLTGASSPLRATVVLVAIGLVSGLHFLTDPSHVLLHELYNYLCFIPIIVAAYWFGPWGGVAAAAVTSAVFIPHIRAAWTTNLPYTTSRYAQVLVFHITGLLVGVLAASQRRLAARYRDAATALETRNRELMDSHAHLRRAERLSAIGEIATGLAHELRNPLAAIRGALDIVVSKVAPGTPEAEFSQIARKELQRLDALVGEFLTYARPRDPELRPAHVSDVLERVVGLLHPEAQRAGVALDLAVARESEPLVLVDSEQISQVFLNVMLNGIQACPRGGLVRIIEGVANDAVTVDVVDPGPGISPQHLSRVFEPFFSTKKNGTGLGLAISQRIVTAHAGSIEVLPGAGTGTRVRVHLPLHGPNGQEPRDHAQA